MRLTRRYLIKCLSFLPYGLTAFLGLDTAVGLQKPPQEPGVIPLPQVPLPRRGISAAPSAVAEIKSSFARFTSDPEYIKANKNLDREMLHREFDNMKQHYASFINFYVYRRYVKAINASRGGISKQTETDLTARGQRAIEAYRNAVTSLDMISNALHSSGMAVAIETHSASVSKHFDVNPKTPEIIDEFRGMGVPEDAISFVYKELHDSGFDPLRAHGLNGKFSDLVKRASDLTSQLADTMRILNQHGLPIFEGAGSQADTYAEAGVVVGIAIIVGLIFGF